MKRERPRRGLGSSAAARFAGALLLATPLATPAAADTDLRGWQLSGDLETGGRIIGGDFGSSKFEEYRWVRPGFVGDESLLIEDPARSGYVRSLGEFVSDRDQHYELDAGHWGRDGVEFEFQKFPHVFSNDALSPYADVGDGVLVLPAGWNFMAGALAGELATRSVPVDLEFRNRIGRAAGFVRPTPDLELRSGYRIVDKQGTLPGSLSFGANPGGNFSNFARPIDERIHEVTAGAELAKGPWGVAFDYTGSFFRNSLESLTVDNPIQGTDVVGSSSRGRMAAAPDNSANQFTASARTALPTGFPAQVAATLGTGLRLQDQGFLPFTINSALASPALPAADLDGRVQTWLGNLKASARPYPGLNLDARYRIYDYDNQTKSLSFPQEVPNDSNVVAANLVSVANDYVRQDAGLEGAYQLASSATLTVGTDWERWNRSDDREVRRLDQYLGKLALDWHPAPRALLRATYRGGVRDGSKYHTMGAQLPELRKFDEADRVLNEVDLLGRFDPCETLSLTLSGGYHHSDFDDSSFGLLDARRWNAGLDAEYRPHERIALTAYYGFESGRFRQGSRSRPPDVPANDWTSTSKDTAHDAGADLALSLIPDRLEADLAYAFQIGRADTDAGGPNPNAVDFPDLRDRLQILSATLTYRVLERLKLRGQYRYEEWDGHDFQLDSLTPTTGPAVLGTNDVFLGNTVEDYRAHIVTLSTVIEF